MFCSTARRARVGSGKCEIRREHAMLSSVRERVAKTYEKYEEKTRAVGGFGRSPTDDSGSRKLAVEPRGLPCGRRPTLCRSFTHEATSRNMSSSRRRAAVAIAVAALLLSVWAELAVGVFTNWGS